MSAEQEHAERAEPGSEPPPLNAFKEQLAKEVDDINRRCGGPAQYLQRLGQPELDDFAKYLWEELALSQMAIRSWLSSLGTLPTPRKLRSSGLEMEDRHWGHSPWAT